MTTPHPHKDVLIAIANGLPISKVEVKHSTWSSWKNFEDYPFDIFQYPHSCGVRIKQKTVMFNGVELSEPIKETPENETLLYMACPEYETKYFEFYWNDSTYEKRSLKRGLIHKTKAAAIAWADAMTPFKD